jgi:hypothetical protein
MFNLADFQVTAYALRNNLDTEANPVMRAAFDLGTPAAFALKVILVAAASWLLFRVPRRTGIVLVWMACALHLSVLFLNLQAIGGI